MRRSLRTLLAWSLALHLFGCSRASDEHREHVTPSADAGGGTSGATGVESAAAPADPSLRAAYVRARQAQGATDARFRVVREGKELVARSAPKSISARIGAGGVALVGDQITARLRARSVRCDARRAELLAGAPRIADRANRAELDHGADGIALHEWYESGPLGVEQGFDVTAGSCDELAIEMTSREPTSSARATSFGSGTVTLRSVTRSSSRRTPPAGRSPHASSRVPVESSSSWIRVVRRGPSPWTHSSTPKTRS